MRGAATPEPHTGAVDQPRAVPDFMLESRTTSRDDLARDAFVLIELAAVVSAGRLEYRIATSP